ncbi:MAG: hypothetical protein F4Y49_08175 [Dehalococcoidia bacterium]|nr:hypothetical protein [Dehalococcoidia bacterium]
MADAASLEAQLEYRTVEGVVVSGTAGDSDMFGQVVTLHRVTAAGFDDITTITDDTGAFRFENIKYDPSTRYGVSVRYQDAIYGTDLEMSTGSPPPVRLTVYEATHDDSIVSASSASLLLASAEASDRTLAALEIITLVNHSDMAYVPGTGVMELLRFGLPPEATELSLDTRLIGADFIQVDRGFALLASVPPGEHEIMFSYRFPYPGETFTLDKSYRYGAESLRILAPEEVVSISVEGLGKPERVMIGERQYRVLEAEGLSRGESLSLELDGLPTPGVTDRVGNSLSGIRFQFAAPVALGVLMVALLAYGAIWKTKGQRREAATSETYSERAVIFRMISDLTDSYESGEISDEEYRQRLMVLNARLTALGPHGQG